MRNLRQPQLFQLDHLWELVAELGLDVDALVVDNLHSQEQKARSGKVKAKARCARMWWGRFLAFSATAGTLKAEKFASNSSPADVLKARMECVGRALGFACSRCACPRKMDIKIAL